MKDTKDVKDTKDPKNTCNVWIIVGILITSIMSIVSLCRSYERTNLEFDYIGVVIGIFSLLITILIGWDIKKSIQIDVEIKEQNDRIKEQDEKNQQLIIEQDDKIKELKDYMYYGVGNAIDFLISQTKIDIELINSRHIRAYLYLLRSLDQIPQLDQKHSNILIERVIENIYTLIRKFRTHYDKLDYFIFDLDLSKKEIEGEFKCIEENKSLTNEQKQKLETSKFLLLSVAKGFSAGKCLELKIGDNKVPVNLYWYNAPIKERKGECFAIIEMDKVIAVTNENRVITLDESFSFLNYEDFIYQSQRTFKSALEYVVAIKKDADYKITPTDSQSPPNTNTNK